VSAWILEAREWLMLAFEGYICAILTLEYFYDARKDELKKLRKTRTTKKTTSTKDGGSMVEESTEISEPMQEEKK
jgi:hypothetical protein